jgi:hypothetical protein
MQAEGYSKTAMGTAFMRRLARCQAGSGCLLHDTSGHVYP